MRKLSRLFEQNRAWAESVNDRDPDFFARLRKDPFGTARAEGFDVTLDDARGLLGMRDATEGEIAEVLQKRLSYAEIDEATDQGNCENFGDWLTGAFAGE